MYRNFDSYNKDVTEIRRERINTLWVDGSKNKNDQFNGSITFNSRWLFPFAKIAITQPRNVGKFIFLSNPSWFSPFLNRVSVSDCMKMIADPKFTRDLTSTCNLRIEYPQSIRYMRKSLGIGDKKTNCQIKDSLYRIFRTTSLWSNIYSYWDPWGGVPYVNLDIFVKLDFVPKYPNLIKVCMGGMKRRGISSLLELAIKLKFFNKKELGFHKDPLVNFYKKLYIDRIHIFDEEELPWGILNPVSLIPIMSGYVDVDRESFLQETLIGRAIFSLYSFGRYKDDYTNLFHRKDIPGLETRMSKRFPTLMDALICGDILLEPLLC